MSAVNSIVMQRTPRFAARGAAPRQRRGAAANVRQTARYARVARVAATQAQVGV